MSLARFTFTFLVVAAFCGLSRAQVDSIEDLADKRKKRDQVVTNLDDHPVHAIRRRKAIAKAKAKALIDASKAVGLDGRWYVLGGKKDGLYSEAQIGQQPGDVISMLPKEEAKGPVFAFT